MPKRFSKRENRKGRNSRELSDILEALALMGLIFWAKGDTAIRQTLLCILTIAISVFVFRQINYYRKMRPLNIAGVDGMTGIEFEHYISKLLKTQGYKVENVGGMNDMGIDLIASRGNQRHAVQMKRWNYQVDMSAVRAAVAGKNYYHCDKSVVITNSYFTWRAKKLAKANECKLIDRDQLAVEIRKMQITKVTT